MGAAQSRPSQARRPYSELYKSWLLACRCVAFGLRPKLRPSPPCLRIPVVWRESTGLGANQGSGPCNGDHFQATSFSIHGNSCSRGMAAQSRFVYTVGRVCTTSYASTVTGWQIPATDSCRQDLRGMLPHSIMVYALPPRQRLVQRSESLPVSI